MKESNQFKAPKFIIILYVVIFGLPKVPTRHHKALPYQTIKTIQHVQHDFLTLYSIEYLTIQHVQHDFLTLHSIEYLSVMRYRDISRMFWWVIQSAFGRTCT